MADLLTNKIFKKKKCRKISISGSAAKKIDVNWETWIETIFGMVDRYNFQQQQIG